MIIKELEQKETSDLFGRAGQKAEQEMAYFLKREFGSDDEAWVFHDLRFQVDENDFAQIDHLIMHPYGFALVESKSVSDSVQIDEFGDWTRWFNKKPKGMPSPIEQVKRQAAALQKILQEHHAELRGKFLMIQRGFADAPFDYFVAVSTNGRITGDGRKAFKDIVLKADQVTGRLRERIGQYKQLFDKGKGQVFFRDEERAKIVRFLLNLHHPVSGESDAQPYDAPEQPVELRTKEPVTVDDYWHCKCGEKFEIRYGYNFYRYCIACRSRSKLSACCPECQGEVELSQVERLILFQCKTHESHKGVFYKNKQIWMKDKTKMGADS